MFTLENKFLRINVSENGAELQNFYHITAQKEWLWQGDPTWWGKRAPFLFPFIGMLKNGQYTYAEQAYSMSKHGFARDKAFIGERLSETHLRFTLCSDESTLVQYPFDFKLIIDYRLVNHTLDVSLCVVNNGSEPMPFSIGGHPAFHCPMDEEPWQVVFAEEEKLVSRCIQLETGLIEPTKMHVLKEIKKLPLSSDLFKQDALVFEGLHSQSLTLENMKTYETLVFEWRGLPILALWSPCGPFICLEPWVGMADLADSNGRLEEKYGIHILGANSQYECGYSMGVKASQSPCDLKRE